MTIFLMKDCGTLAINYSSSIHGTQSQNRLLQFLTLYTSITASPDSLHGVIHQRSDSRWHQHLRIVECWISATVKEGSRQSQGNYPYSDILGVMDSSQPETSFHMKLHPPVADVPLTIAGSSSKSTPIMNNTFSMANYGHNSYLDVSTSKEGPIDNDGVEKENSEDAGTT
ncbi:hypothetical protein M9H77_21552 [Catharanthus roseus]|uniref:Uncharacterized protein n=1 Tax=Catharanthus roseus TaxID=4058 RepID=A0ACC0AN17_CATRO|nr:hypothetical protein M9H77_21552 [Catharanthus roseus]